MATGKSATQHDFTSLYLELPLLWSGMMAWAGVKVGRSIELATGTLKAPARYAGLQGGTIGKAVLLKGSRRYDASVGLIDTARVQPIADLARAILEHPPLRITLFISSSAGVVWVPAAKRPIAATINRMRMRVAAWASRRPRRTPVALPCHSILFCMSQAPSDHSFQTAAIYSRQIQPEEPREDHGKLL